MTVLWMAFSKEKEILRDSKMTEEKGSYLKERHYLTDSVGKSRGKSSEKYQYWEHILGKEKAAQLAAENESVRLHLEEVPYVLWAQDSSKTETQDNPKTEMQDRGAEHKDSAASDFLKAENPVFAPYYQKILEEALLRFRMKTEKRTIPHSARVEQDLLRHLLDGLQKISIRTLLLEMRLLKAEGRLAGVDEKEEYEDFLDAYLGSGSYIREIHGRYPVLHRMMKEQAVQGVDYFCEIIEHLEEDRQEIETRILGGNPILELTGIRCMRGDVHHHGRSVAFAVLDGGKEVVYKPHSLDNELLFQDILKRIGQGISLWDSHMCPKIAGRPGHGWEEKIGYQECSTLQDVKRFYERAGMQLFLAYLFGTGDLHCENLIARGDSPVLIDLETLIRLRAKGAAQDVFLDSVLASGILPVYLPSDRGMGNEVGALGGEGGKKSRMQVPVIRNAYTSRMQIEYRHGIMGHAQNRTRCGGRPVQPAQYRKELQSGFEKAYRYVNNSPKVQAYILKQAENIQSRQLLSDTMKYAALLNSSCHPDLMADGGDRELFIRSVGLVGRTREQSLVECEARAMLRGDIPSFYNEGRHLMCEQEICIPEYFADTPKEAVQNRMARLGRRDERFQKKLIELSLTIAGNQGKNRVESGGKRVGLPRGAVDRRKLEDAMFSACEKAAELILDNVYEDEDGNLQILSIDLAGQSRSRIRKAGRCFYEGLPGIALFLYALEKKTADMQSTKPDQKGGAQFRHKVAMRLLDQLEEDTISLELAEESAAKRTGLFDGEFSIVFTYLLLYEIGGEEKYLSLARAHTEKILPLLQEDSSFDLLGGNAGGVLGLLKLYDLTGDSACLAAARKAGRILYSRAERMEHGIGWSSAEAGKTPLCGMAHGNSGMLAAFARLYQRTGETVFRDACTQCLDYEDSMYEELFHDWKDLRDEAVRRGQAVSQEMAWCHGAGGIALSRKLAADALSGETEADTVRLRGRMERDIQRALPGLVKQFLREEMCVCHGTFGNYQILKKLEGYLEDSVMERARAEVYAQVMRLDKEEPDLILQEYHSPGFMNGLAGIGYYLLREMDERLPDILEL